jgi:hypothetical protein
MADGASHRILGAELRSPRLHATQAARSSLWAVCNCGREAPIDASGWFAQGLGRHCVDNLEHRLRCLCGARRVPLEIRGLAEAPSGVTGGIYIFR